jgi:hypothetical protein
MLVWSGSCPRIEHRPRQAVHVETAAVFDGDYPHGRHLMHTPRTSCEQEPPQRPRTAAAPTGCARARGQSLHRATCRARPRADERAAGRRGVRGRAARDRSARITLPDARGARASFVRGSGERVPRLPLRALSSLHPRDDPADRGRGHERSARSCAVRTGHRGGARVQERASRARRAAGRVALSDAARVRVPQPRAAGPIELDAAAPGVPLERGFSPTTWRATRRASGIAWRTSRRSSSERRAPERARRRRRSGARASRASIGGGRCSCLGQASASSRRTWRRCPRRSSSRRSLDTRRAPSPGRPRRPKASSRVPPSTARSSWTSSATCRCTCR